MTYASPATGPYKLCPVCLGIYPASANFCARDQAELRPDDRILVGKFVLLRRIGEGTMGEVYEAEQPRLRRKVAVKLLRPDPEVMERFDQEVEAAGSLNHPHVVTIYDSGRAEDGRGYIVMEYLDGESLAERLRRRGPMAPVEAAAVWLQAVRAMAAAHGHGVVHRDLKPDNLFIARRVTEDGPGEQVKVLDFGIAKIMSALAEARRDGRGTSPGMLVGTMPYMAPEQLEHGQADERADVYALGLILCEMLTGRLPWGESREEGYNLFALRLLRPPRALRELRPDGGFSPELEQLVADALRREPQGRPAHAGELLQRARLLPEVRGDSGAWPKTSGHTEAVGPRLLLPAPLSEDTPRLGPAQKRSGLSQVGAEPPTAQVQLEAALGESGIGDQTTETTVESLVAPLGESDTTPPHGTAAALAAQLGVPLGDRAGGAGDGGGEVGGGEAGAPAVPAVVVSLGSAPAVGSVSAPLSPVPAPAATLPLPPPTQMMPPPTQMMPMVLQPEVTQDHARPAIGLRWGVIGSAAVLTALVLGALWWGMFRPGDPPGQLRRPTEVVDEAPGRR